MTSVPINLCQVCSRWKGYGAGCDAFQDIPADIWDMEFNHQKKHEGDRGLTFKPNMVEVSALPDVWKQYLGL